MALLLMPGASRSVRVPLYADTMRYDVEVIENVNVRPYIREAGEDISNVIDGSQTRQVLSYDDHEFVVIRNHEQSLNETHHRHASGPIRREGDEVYHPLSPLSGSLLVVKRSSAQDHRLLDISRGEEKKVVDILIA
jgi:hypothetical protein